MNSLQSILFFLILLFYTAIWAERDKMHFYISLTGNYEIIKDKSGLRRGGKSEKEKLRGINNTKYFPKKSYGNLLL